MGVQDLQSFLESGEVKGTSAPVNLIKLAKNLTDSKSGPDRFSKLSLVLDGECCLDRLYGGFFSDWVCGGQWNRAVAFVAQLSHVMMSAKLDVVVFLDGASGRRNEWIAAQLMRRSRIERCLRHVAIKGTPPPKVWWVAPSGLRATLAMALRNQKVPLFVSVDDHKQEVIGFCRENNCDGIIADDGEYIAFDPPRYFSASSMKLTYKGSLDTKEYSIPTLRKALGLTIEQMAVFAALLGGHALPESDLSDLHNTLTASNINVKTHHPKNDDGNKKDGNVTNPGNPMLVKALAEFLKNLKYGHAKNMNELGLEVFGTVGQERCNKFKLAVQYYLNGTQNGFLNYSRNLKAPPNAGEKRSSKKIVIPGEGSDSSDHPSSSNSQRVGGFRLASDSHNELASLVSLGEATACLTVSDDSQDQSSPASKDSASTAKGKANGGESLVISVGCSGSSSGGGSPRAESTKSDKKVRLVVDSGSGGLPVIAPEVMRTVAERHAKGLMSPLIQQILTTAEVRLPVVMEEEGETEVPNIQLLYRPLRQMVYAILFNVHHQQYLARSKNLPPPPMPTVKEWIWSKSNPYTKPEVVKADQVGWGVPTVQRLWFGTTVDDKRRRLRAFLTCMHADTPLMLDASYVPQHLLVLAATLRYIMTVNGKRVLRKYELDAIIATAMDPHLSNSEYCQELKVDHVSSRCIQVGALVMTGIEHALLVNDACGAPVPWIMACPWLYFDGKLLHTTMVRAANARNAMELCSHRLPQVMKVERMREAILDGLFVKWAQPPLGLPSAPHHPPGANCCPGVNIGKGYQRVALPPSQCACPTSPTSPGGGGRLEIAGIVVGNWGANCRLPMDSTVPQVTSVGGGRGGRGGIVRGGRGGNRGGSGGGGGGGGGARGAKSRGSGNRGKGGGKGRGGLPKSQGRGVTAVSAFTGEVIKASEYMRESESSNMRILQQNQSETSINGASGGQQNSLIVNGAAESEQN